MKQEWTMKEAQVRKEDSGETQASSEVQQGRDNEIICKQGITMARSIKGKQTTTSSSNIVNRFAMLMQEGTSNIENEEMQHKSP